MREWLSDCQWSDIDNEDIQGMDDEEINRRVHGQQYDDTHTFFSQTDDRCYDIATGQVVENESRQTPQYLGHDVH